MALSCALLLLLQATTTVSSFIFSQSLPYHAMSAATSTRGRTFLSAKDDDGAKSDSTSDATMSTTSKRRQVSVPLSLDEMVRQAASAMKEASSTTTNGPSTQKQIVRLLLPRDAGSGDLGRYYEGNAVDAAEISLVPPDESWQGGIMQLYRAAAPMTERLLRAFTTQSASNDGGVPSRVTEDRSVDESGVDGVGLFATQDGKVSCWLQPTQENIDAIEASAKKAGEDDIVVLVNPQWRLVDDALDTYSKNEGFLGGLANFLGGKGGSLKRLKDAGFTPVYTLEGYVCRGANVRLLQILDSEWTVFCERDNGESYIEVGSKATRPTYADVDEMLQNADIGYKYARDIGLQPKL